MIYVAGSLNMDLRIESPYMPVAGETITGSNFITNGGGKGANQATAAAKLGGKVKMCGVVGNDAFGDTLLANLKNAGADVSHVRKENGVSTGIAMIIVTENNNRIILDKGANACLTKEDIDHNAACFKKQMERFIDFSDGKALMVNNADWLMDLNYVDVLREVGAHFSVNRMLTAECYKQRMEKGLSFLEFNYMIMQSYDFYTLFQKYGCNMEFGGDDQWSNMLGGTELIRRKLGKDAYAMTINLLLNSEGKKMGKTQSGAVWLDPNKTSPFDFFQYWRNVSDADVLKCLRMLTFLPLEQIDEMDKWEGAQLNEAKEILAFELTKMVHGEEEAEKAKEASHALFSGAGASANMPTIEVNADDFANGTMDIMAVLVKAGLCESRSEARRGVQQGGVSVDGEKVTDISTTYTLDDFAGEGKVVKRGKKKFAKVVAVN